jgi:hypothetical protein
MRVHTLFWIGGGGGKIEDKLMKHNKSKLSISSIMYFLSWNQFPSLISCVIKKDENRNIKPNIVTLVLKVDVYNKNWQFFLPNFFSNKTAQVRIAIYETNTYWKQLGCSKKCWQTLRKNWWRHIWIVPYLKIQIRSQLLTKRKETTVPFVVTYFTMPKLFLSRIEIWFTKICLKYRTL